MSFAFDKEIIHHKDEWKENFKKHIVSGSCIIEDGVAYNFSTSNRMSPFGGKKNFNPSTTPWEWMFVIEPTTLNVYQIIAKSNHAYGTSIVILATNLVRFNASSGTSSFNIGTIDSTKVLELNKKYWLQVKYTGTQYELHISENGIDFELQGTIAKSTAIRTGDLRFGINNGDNTDIYKGKLYIKESYIKVNDEIWWSYDTHGIKYQGTVFNYDSTKHTYSCSGSNGLAVPKLFHTNGKPWYIKVKFKTDDLSTTTNRNIIGSMGNDIKLPLIILLPDRFKFYLTSNGSSWDLANGTEIQGLSLEIKQYTEYIVGIGWDGDRYYTTIKYGNQNFNITVESSNVPIYDSDELIVLGNNLAIESRSLQSDIYLDETEIYIDNELWWNCKYNEDIVIPQNHNLFYNKTLIHKQNDYKFNATKLLATSSGTVYDGVAQGFSSTQFLYLPENLPLKGCTSFEMVVKFKYDNSSTSFQALLTENGVSYAGALGISTDGHLTFCLDANHADNYSICDIKGTITLSHYNTYWAKAVWTGDRYELYLSYDGTYWISQGSKSTTTAPNYSMRWNIGNRNKSGNDYWVLYNEIYLKDCYININGERFWDYSKGLKFTGNWLCYNEENHTYACRGRSCLIIPKIFNTNGKPWEFKTKIKTDDLTSTQGRNFVGAHNAINYTYPNFQIYKNNFRCYLSSNGTSWDIANPVLGTTALSINTEYYIKFGWDGSNYYLDYSLDGDIYTRDIEITSNKTLYEVVSPRALGNNLYDAESDDAFDILMYLDDTEIYIDNELWWNCKYNEDIYINHPYNLATKKLGIKKGTIINKNININENLTNNDATISGFSSTSYITIPLDYLTELYNNETGNRGLVIKFKTPSELPTSSYQQVCNSVYFDNDSLSYPVDSLNNSSIPISPNTYYWVKYGGFAVDYNDGDLLYNFQVSTDGINWIGDLSNAFYDTYETGFVIGTDNYDTTKHIFTGEIDLTESYFLDNHSKKRYLANPDIYYNTYY